MKETHLTYKTMRDTTLQKQMKRVLEAKEFTAKEKNPVKVSVKNRNIIKQYADYLRRTHKGRYTTQQMNLQWLKLLIMDMNGKDLDKITREDIQRYLAKIVDEVKNKTYNNKQFFLQRFMCWLKGKSYEELQTTLLKDIKKVDDEVNLLEKVILEPEDVKELIRVANNIRDKCIVSMLYETGSRKGEFLQLKIKHLNLKDRSIIIPMGKTKSRVNYLQTSYPYLKEWYESHPDKDNPEAPLFLTQGSHLNQGLADSGLKIMLKVLQGRAKIKKNIYPHLFRHSRASFFARHNMNEGFMRNWFGWSDTSKTPSLYIHLYSKDIQNSYLKMMGLTNGDNKDELQQEKEAMQPKSCPNKNCQNYQKKEIPYTCELCPICNTPLDLELAVEQREKRDAEIKDKMMQIFRDGFKEVMGEELPKDFGKKK